MPAQNTFNIMLSNKNAYLTNEQNGPNVTSDICQSI